MAEDQRDDRQDDLVDTPVEVRDPSLNARANEILTEEARESLGTDHVQLPKDKAERAATTDLTDEGSPLESQLWRSRVLMGMSGATAIVVGGILTLATGSVVWLIVAVAILVVAVVLVTLGVIETQSNVEQPSPEHVEELEEEGVKDPEEALNNAIRNFSGDDESRTKEVLMPGGNEDSARPFEQSATSSVQQQSALTPSSEATESAGVGDHDDDSEPQ